jgi:hypothetical protein
MFTWTDPPLANTRQWVADEHVHDTAASVPRSREHGARRLLPYLTDHLCFLAARSQAKRVQRCIGVFRSDHGEELAFIRDVQRVKPQQLACASDRITHRNLIFEENNA